MSWGYPTPEGKVVTSLEYLYSFVHQRIAMLSGDTFSCHDAGDSVVAADTE